jgi:glutamyl-tRNA reductase
MRRLGMVGTTFRKGGQAALEALTFPPEERAERVRLLHERCGFGESVYLATCNRVEVVFAGKDGVSVAEYRERLYRVLAGGTSGEGRGAGEREAARRFHAYGGEGAAEHLFCVAAALDSMVPGEAQILGQVKEAFHMSGELGLVGPRLALLFEEAFRAAKKVRRSTSLSERPVSMVSLALGLLQERLGDAGGRLALIGSGEMTRQCAETFAPRDEVGLVFVNRTFAAAEALAERYGGTAVALSGFQRDPGRIDAIVTATAAPRPILGHEVFARLKHAGGVSSPPLVVDLAVPRDADPEAAAAVGASLYDIDRLEAVAARNRKQREGAMAEARVVLDEALDALRRRLVDREMGPLVRALHRRYQRTVDEGLSRLFGNGGATLDSAQQERLSRWAESLVKRFAHIPTLGLKRLAFERGTEAVESFLNGVKGDLGLDTLNDGDSSRLQTDWSDSEEFER